jgi:hypothetical protein
VLRSASSIACIFASLIRRSPAAARTAVAHFGFIAMIQLLKFLGYLAVLLSIVPIVGLCVTGSVRQAWRYTRDWSRVMLGTVLVAAIVFIVVAPL